MKSIKQDTELANMQQYIYTLLSFCALLGKKGYNNHAASFFLLMLMTLRMLYIKFIIDILKLARIIFLHRMLVPPTIWTIPAKTCSTRQRTFDFVWLFSSCSSVNGLLRAPFSDIMFSTSAGSVRLGYALSPYATLSFTSNRVSAPLISLAEAVVTA